MITLKIDDVKLEQIYNEQFEGNDVAFVEYLSNNCHANNIEYDGDYSELEALYDEGEASGDSGLTHEEVFTNLRKKYGIN